MVALCICCWKKSNGVIPSSLSYYSANAFYSMGKRWGRWEKKPLFSIFPMQRFFFSLSLTVPRFASSQPLLSELKSVLITTIADLKMGYLGCKWPHSSNTVSQPTLIRSFHPLCPCMPHEHTCLYVHYSTIPHPALTQWMKLIRWWLSAKSCQR